MSLQINSTRHFSQRCCAINSSCFFTIPFIMVSIRPNLSDTVSSSSASSDSTSVSLSFPFPLPFASSSVFFLRFTRSDPFSAVPQPFFIAMHLWHEVLLPSLLKSAVSRMNTGCSLTFSKHTPCPPSHTSSNYPSLPLPLTTPSSSTATLMPLVDPPLRTTRASQPVVWPTPPEYLVAHRH